MIQQHEINLAVARIVESYNPEKIFLFGSYALGNPTADSDLDFMIIKQTNLLPQERDAKVLRSLFGLKLPIDLLVYTPEEISQLIARKQPFVTRILQEGILLYEKK